MVIGVAYINVPNENIKILHNDNNVTINGVKKYDIFDLDSG